MGNLHSGEIFGDFSFLVFETALIGGFDERFVFFHQFLTNEYLFILDEETEFSLQIKEMFRLLVIMNESAEFLEDFQL